MNLCDVEALFERIKECVEFYERTYIKNKIFTMFLGNGEQVKYAVTPDNLPHLLGINLDIIRTTYNYSNTSAYDLMIEMLENPYRLHRLFKDNILKIEQVFSKNINEKLEGFKDNFKYDAREVLEDTDFVCKFESENSWTVTAKKQKYDYIIVKTLPNNKIALLGLVKNGFQCYAMSNQLFNSLEEAKDTLNELLTNQKVTLLTGFKTYNRMTDGNFNWTLTINQKLEKVDTIKNYKNNFNFIIDITSDYEYTIQKMLENKYERRENYSTGGEIVDYIVNRQIIPRENFEGSKLINIIDAWNDHICMNSSIENDSSTYTKVVTDLKAFKELALRLEKENDNLKDQVLDLTQKNDNLTEENEKHLKDKEEIIKILKPELIN